VNDHENKRECLWNDMLMEHVRNVNGQSVIHHDDGCVCVCTWVSV